MPGHNSGELLEHVRSAVGDETVSIEASGVWGEPTDVSDNRVGGPSGRYTGRFREVFPGAVVAPGLATVTTDSRHYDRIADDTFRFIPMRMTNEDLERLHGVDERIAVENYHEIVRFFARQIRNSAS